MKMSVSQSLYQKVISCLYLAYIRLFLDLEFSWTISLLIFIPDNYRDQPIRAERDHHHTGTITSNNRNHNFLNHYFDNDERDFSSSTKSSLSRNQKDSTTIKKSSSVAMIDECQDFMIIAAVLGCLLIAASVMMCILSHRLFKLTRRYKIQKLEDVVAEHRRKFGAGGGNNALSNTGGVLRFPHWSRQTGRVSSTSHQIRNS